MIPARIPVRRCSGHHRTNCASTGFTTAKSIAFTLVELLIVIGILALLAAILLPVFFQTREAVRKSGCLSHVHQLGVATTMYLQDYDEVFPLVLYVPGDEPVPRRELYSVFDLLHPYVKIGGVTECPTEPKAFDYPAIARRYGLRPVNLGNFSSYVPNGGLYTGGCQARLIRPRGVRSLAQVGYPSDQPAFYEGFLTVGLDTPVFGRHREGMNLSFADGHAGYLHLGRNPSPSGVDAASGRYVDGWYIDRGPFRLPHDTTDQQPALQRSFMIFGLVTDPVCGANVVMPCNINPPCG
jgi:prepilin-type processing-associated H-X9-DG protein